jgi:hypothetical protein
MQVPAAGAGWQTDPDSVRVLPAPPIRAADNAAGGPATAFQPQEMAPAEPDALALRRLPATAPYAGAENAPVGPVAPLPPGTR